ncbi:MAG: hypothetical protein JJ971_02615 [Balneolaceae bacterium]|nr:hypothetical protein [Balneolaceae bacterium]MBO6545264.1 hypothetical protein [Balneolaceae bacterium]MBO6646660.1 hypothetical protein [Balneolaceae bacterium]
MKKSVWCTTIFLSLLVSIFTFVPTNSVFAQSEVLTLDITLSPALENAQVLGLTSLGVDNKGSGPVLFSGSLVNNTNEKLDNLFFEFLVQSGNVGVIAQLTQQAAYPFTLDPGQVVFGDNNDIVNEKIPGIEETMRFDGGLTPEGEDFLESLESTTLPADFYTLTISVFQVTNALGKEVLATQTVELGGSEDGAIVDEKTILLKNPGDVIGAEVNITNPFPQFSWEGDAANTYRLVVVRANGQDSPESLIEIAKSSEPTNQNGSLQQFENLDLTTTGNTIQYPSSGVQALQAGQTYYWQVSTEVQTAIDAEEFTSEIWTFKLASPGDNSTLVEIDQDAFDALIALIGEEEYAALTESGYAFESIEINNQIVSGATAIQLLTEIIQKIDDGDIILNNN